MASTANASFLQKFINSETGPKTIHFWVSSVKRLLFFFFVFLFCFISNQKAPVMKWALVIAGINDIQRPVEKMSGTQQIALFATGAIWTRWCLIIKPKNYFLASVNFFLGAVAGYQISRIYGYQRSLGYSPSKSVLEIIHPSEQAGDKIDKKIEAKVSVN